MIVHLIGNVLYYSQDCNRQHMDENVEQKRPKDQPRADGPEDKHSRI